MSEPVTIIDHGYVPEEHAPDPVIGHGDPTPPGKIAIWLFLASEIMFFIAILGTYIILRSGSHELFAKFAAVLSKPLAAVNTLVLILSSLTMALAVDGAQKNLRGRVITCDVNEETTAIARRYAEEAGVADRIDYRLGPGLETIAQLDGPFDLVFIDADKPNYVNYYEATLPLLAHGGLMVLDNTLWSGRVADRSEDDDNVRAIRAVNERVLEDPRVDNVLLTVRDGMNLVWWA